MKVETEHLKLPLRTAGHVQMQRSLREGFEKLDKAVSDLGGGAGGTPDPRVETLVADVADIKTRLEAVEAFGARITAVEAFEARIAALEAANPPAG